ncbi:ribosomal L7Ae/L30e/S12e/Gadd45 family protein [Alicyclobacillus cycloheptanicus]|jgi:large subunit ribosomal protein L7A|uniref:Large subunit ribosomal protein L7A n=1 Tax=Alicyclobacillus cycloheptanicus TaxID=1457 RepID=A0ABT9XKU2_9BACL|nr:ribosomal L7Ae/L30e/S12e/Gadd45 family protein [Alicyclobacillus cycloheptanicus]MDQ0190398.1 large subunit ribosomal protein L7A [Alicyclobacillus cycloheptanicus]WDM02638.1 ribosomal L7Ae/L30e/S12e/Gadd45 family protein [Alicyclobacillus cycloheptanicus]
MSLDRIHLATKRTIGANQTTKALQQSKVRELFVAKDAEERVTRPLVSAAQERGIPIFWVDSMKQLGKACGIEVGAATAAILED